jgi:hypothetical protein
MTDIVPSYIEARIRQRPPDGVPVVQGSTPVVAFGDVRKAEVATLGWNPSKREFLDRSGNELVDNERRLETLVSIGETDLSTASDNAILRIFDASNEYFHRCPYFWFGKLEKILKQVGASFYDGSACHLDFVQWATDPVWSRLPPSDQPRLIDADLPFLRRQLSQEKIRLLLLNGKGIVNGYQERLGGVLTESCLPGGRPLRLFTGWGARRLRVVGWNINLQASHGVSNQEIEVIGTAVKTAMREMYG